MALVCIKYSETNPTQCVSYQGIYPPDFSFAPLTNNVDYSTLITSILFVFAALVAVSLVIIGAGFILKIIKPKHYDTKRFKSESEAVFYYQQQNARFNRAYNRTEKLLGRELTNAEAGILHKKYFKN